MSKELREKLGSAEKTRLINWTRANEEDARRKELTLPLSINYKGTLLKNDTFRFDQQGRFDDLNSTTWLNLQVQMSNATLVTIYVHWDGYVKARISPAEVLWAMTWSATKEWEHHTVYVGYKDVGYEEKKGGKWKTRPFLNVITKECQPRDLTGKICTGSDLEDISKNPVPNKKDARKDSDKNNEEGKS